MLTSLVVMTIACSQVDYKDRFSAPPTPSPATTTNVVAAHVPLSAKVVDDRTVALRSPTFRCGPDYCGSAVLLGLQEILGKGSFDWRTAAVPDEEFVELVIVFDPQRFDVTTIVGAVKEAMERYPDPAHPGPVLLHWEN